MSVVLVLPFGLNQRKCIIHYVSHTQPWYPGTADSAPHWHYVSCGLTDLHGDARVHPPATSPEAASGYGFELSFR